MANDISQYITPTSGYGHIVKTVEQKFQKIGDISWFEDLEKLRFRLEVTHVTTGCPPKLFPLLLIEFLGFLGV